MRARLALHGAPQQTMPCPAGSAKPAMCCDGEQAGRIVPLCPLRTDIPARCNPSLMHWKVGRIPAVPRCATPSVSFLPSCGQVRPDVRWRCGFLLTARFSASRGRGIREVRHPTSWRPTPSRGSRSPRAGNPGMKPSRPGRFARVGFGRIYRLICPCNSANRPADCVPTAHDLWLCVVPETSRTLFSATATRTSGVDQQAVRYILSRLRPSRSHLPATSHTATPATATTGAATCPEAMAG